MPSVVLVRLILFLQIYASCIRAIWPEPQKYNAGSSVVRLSPDLRLEYEPLRTPLRSLQWLLSSIREGNIAGEKQLPTSVLLTAAFERMKHNIIHQNIVPRKFHPRGSLFEPSQNSTKHPIVNVLTVREVNHLQSLTSGSDQSSEAYSISVDDDGRANIQIISAAGGLNALQTFSQLFFAHSDPRFGVYCPYSPLFILDSPNFEHRGLNLDIARNWIPPKDVMHTIEALAATKMNRLHLHASDAQSWPLEVPSLPNLALKGAYDSSQIWTVADLEAVQYHGALHGVEVFLEIDLPGHTTAIGEAYPDLVIAANKELWSEFALQPPSGQLKLNSSNVAEFVGSLLDDLVSRSSSWSSKFHIGGDELNLNAYTLDPTVRSSSPKILQPLVQSFVDHVISKVQAHGVQPIVWEEMVLEWNITLPENAIVQTWRSESALNAVLAKSHKTLFGPNSHWYLDCGFGFYVDPSLRNPDLKDPERETRPPYLDYCSPYKNWRHVYSYNPLKEIRDELRHLIIGGEVHLWNELTDSVTLDSKLWPRVAAAAEVMWSGTEKMPDEGTTRRLAEFRERLVERGVGASVVQMEWCLRNKGGCTL
ncbi:MAG: hypothetical protein Q9195_008606 [Heterodermia aff. obscurata]